MGSIVTVVSEKLVIHMWWMKQWWIIIAYFFHLKILLNVRVRIGIRLWSTCSIRAAHTQNMKLFISSSTPWLTDSCLCLCVLKYYFRFHCCTFPGSKGVSWLQMKKKKNQQIAQFVIWQAYLPCYWLIHLTILFDRTLWCLRVCLPILVLPDIDFH